MGAWARGRSLNIYPGNQVSKWQSRSLSFRTGQRRELGRQRPAERDLHGGGRVEIGSDEAQEVEQDPRRAGPGGFVGDHAQGGSAASDGRCTACME